MLGVEPMRGDAGPQLPFTNRMIAGLAAMPNVQIVSLNSDRNRFQLGSWPDGKVIVTPSLHANQTCMAITYTLFQAGEQRAVYGVVVPALPAGQEPDSACVDRAANALYQNMVVEGF